MTWGYTSRVGSGAAKIGATKDANKRRLGACMIAVGGTSDAVSMRTLMRTLGLVEHFKKELWQGQESEDDAGETVTGNPL